MCDNSNVGFEEHVLVISMSAKRAQGIQKLKLLHLEDNLYKGWCKYNPCFLIVFEIGSKKKAWFF
jgi:hypothetical protein